MLRLAWVPAVIALVACSGSNSSGGGGGTGGSGGGSAGSSATINGKAMGFGFTPTSTSAQLEKDSSGNVTHASVRITTAADYCQLKKSGCTVDAIDILDIDLLERHAGTDLAISTGAYTAMSDFDPLPDDTLAAYGTIGRVHHGGIEPPVAGTDSTPFMTWSGSLNVTVLGPDRVTGTFDLVFGQQNDHITGSFDAPVCQVDSESWSGDGSAICDGGP
ncbi:MAG: hypothetical protein QM723_27950 [Myxococcaceae bacterium]